MKYRLTLLLILCWCPLLLAAPQAKFDTLEHDAGKLPQGKPFEYAFELRNLGDQYLQFEAKPCCGVTVSAPGGPIKPGEVRRFNVRMSTTYKTGPFSRTIEVVTNDPANAKFSLVILGDVVEELAVRPNALLFKRINPGMDYGRRIVLTNMSEHAITIRALRGKPEGLLDVDFDEEFELAPGESRRVTVTLKAQHKPGNVFGSVEVVSDLVYAPHKSIRVQATVSR